MINYVLGFAVSEDRKYIYLLHKKRGPRFIIGKWNGIGGKIEPGELPYDAMAREFREETNVSLDRWQLRGEVTYANDGDPFKIYLLTTLVDRRYIPEMDKIIKQFNIDNPDTETVLRFSLDSVCAGNFDTMDNIPWMVQLCLDDSYNYVVMNIE